MCLWLIGHTTHPLRMCNHSGAWIIRLGTKPENPTRKWNLGNHRGRISCCFTANPFAPIKVLEEWRQFAYSGVPEYPTRARSGKSGERVYRLLVLLICYLNHKNWNPLCYRSITGRKTPFFARAWFFYGAPNKKETLLLSNIREVVCPQMAESYTKLFWYSRFSFFCTNPAKIRRLRVSLGSFPLFAQELKFLFTRGSVEQWNHLCEFAHSECSVKIAQFEKFANISWGWCKSRTFPPFEPLLVMKIHRKVLDEGTNSKLYVSVTEAFS